MTSEGDRMSRRMFLGASAGVALLVAAPPAWVRSAAGATWRAMAGRPGSLTRSRFTPVLGDTLRMTGGGEAVDVVLAEITDIPPVLRADDQNRFALFLHAPAGHRASEGIRTFEHDEIGTVALFVSPVGAGLDPAHYEAVINRSRS